MKNLKFSCHVRPFFAFFLLFFEHSLSYVTKCKINSNQVWIFPLSLFIFRSLFGNHLALLLLYDVTNKTSFDNIRAWLGEIREYAQENVVIMLLGMYEKTLSIYIFFSHPSRPLPFNFICIAYEKKNEICVENRLIDWMRPA